MTIVFKSNMQECIGEIESRLARNVARATEHTRNKLVEKVNTVGTGRMYNVPNTNKMHQASSPGDPPAVLFGQLKGSFQTRYSNEDGKFMGYVGPVGVPYAKRLEFGFTGEDALGRKYNQEPRPFMRPVAFENEDEIQRILRGGLVND